MSWRTLSRRGRVVNTSTHRRRIGVALILALALAVAACGSSTGEGMQPTPKPNPTATTPPVPCAGWRIVASPTTTVYTNSSLSAVSALSPSLAWAVGSTFTAGETTNKVDSLIEQWDGSAWRIAASVSTDNGGLQAITALSPTDVWAAGGQFMHWNGTTWTVVPIVYPAGARTAGIAGLAAIATNDVWAVGNQWPEPGDQLPYQPLVEHWNGASWQIVTGLPLPPTTNLNNGGSLNGVTRIPGTNELWAVGRWQEALSMNPGKPLIERWTGAAWQIVPSPALPANAMGGSWSGVVALSATDAWVAGAFQVKNPMDNHPLIAHWDGASWKNVVADPATYGVVGSVAALSKNDVRAAGTLITGSGASSGNGQAAPLIEQWNGSAWQISTLPALPSGALFQGHSIATGGSGAYWAVGSYLNPTGNGQYQTQPLTLHCP